MAGRPKQDQNDESPGAPEWMLTYSDCMTLLLTFFVMLITYSSFDDKVYRRMKSAFADGLGSIGLRPIRDNQALVPTPQIVYKESPDKGSERPTAGGTHRSNPRTNLEFLDFERQKTFLIPSDEVFWGRGVRMSAPGRQLLADIATLLQATNNRVVVSERAPGSTEDRADLEMHRAWTILQFLTDERGLDRNRFSISSGGATPTDTLKQSGLLTQGSSPRRVIEITILERSTYH